MTPLSRRSLKRHLSTQPSAAVGLQEPDLKPQERSLLKPVLSFHPNQAPLKLSLDPKKEKHYLNNNFYRTASCI